LRAIISDIHANLESLEAVLADIKSIGITEIYCLGDIVGYGPNPCECIDLVMSCKVCLLGNHDQGALFDPEGFNQGAERAIFWTRKMLEIGDREANERRWEFLGELPRMRREPNTLFVHGSARNPLNEYVFPEDIYNQRKMERIFGLVDKYCFQGHTHIPGIFTEDLNFLSVEEINSQYTLGDQKVLINVGSVGQPRDGDNRAAYVVLNGKAAPAADGDAATVDSLVAGLQPGHSITYRRVPYDFEKTARKIYDIPDLDNFLGDRLRDGR